MADDTRLSGLLSKVAKFVRNPTRDWSELDEKDAVVEGGYSKEALKEMIERKRQNDFVRKREFDHLRKLRRREPLAGPDPGRPSFFQSSMASNHDDRAETLKKIDEIEAQMSRQWWKGKDGLSRPGGVSPTAPGMPVPAAPYTSTPERADPGPTLPPSMMPAGATVPLGQERLFRPTEPASVEMMRGLGGGSADAGATPSQLAESAATVPAEMPKRGALGFGAAVPEESVSVAAALRSAVGSGFSTQRLYARAPTDNLTDPDLEDAAIRFANGDTAGAEASLMNALNGSAQRPDLAEVWMSALFDLYRITGQQARFDQVALDFANRFGRSAPAWFSMPDQQRRHVPATSHRTAPPSDLVADWVSPALLKESDLELLKGKLDRPGQIVVDWQHLAAVHPGAAIALGLLMARWCLTPADLVFLGYQSLERALAQLTPSGDRGVDPKAWQARMDALRVMHLQDAFELAALDYCVTYEVSPPSWQAPNCTCRLEGYVDPDEAEAADIRSHWDETPSRWDDPISLATMPTGVDGDEAPAVVELWGEIAGDAVVVVARLDRAMGTASRLVISCARLIRVDFTAAGSLLNWAAQQQGVGNQVQFREVNHMVAAFFNVIGISEYARVFPRSG